MHLDHTISCLPPISRSIPHSVSLPTHIFLKQTLTETWIPPVLLFWLPSESRIHLSLPFPKALELQTPEAMPDSSHVYQGSKLRPSCLSGKTLLTNWATSPVPYSLFLPVISKHSIVCRINWRRKTPTKCSFGCRLVHIVDVGDPESEKWRNGERRAIARRWNGNRDPRSGCSERE